MTIEKLNEEVQQFSNAIQTVVNTGIQRGLPASLIVATLEQTKLELFINLYALKNQEGKTGEDRSQPSNSIDEEPRLVLPKDPR